MIKNFSRLLLALGGTATLGCSTDPQSLVAGYYTVQDTGIRLTLHPSGVYEFCVETCSRGRYKARFYDGNVKKGRIEFEGAALERFANVTSGRYPQWPEYGSIELSFEVGWIFPTMIYFGIDKAFVKN